MTFREVANLQYEQALLQDQYDRKMEFVKDRETVVTTCNNAINSWNTAYSTDQTNKSHTARINTYNSAEWKTLMKVNKNFIGGDYSNGKAGKIENIKFVNENDAAWRQMQNEALVIESKKEAIDSQLEMKQQYLKSLDKLRQNDAKEDFTLWCIGG